MASEYFIIFDKGDNWEVTDTMIVPDGFEVSKDGVLDMSDEDMKSLFLFVKSMLSTHRVLIPKNYEGRLIKEDLIMIPYDALEIERQRKLKDGREVVSSRISIPQIFNAVEFIVLNTYFQEKGIYINDTNRTEKYLEVIDIGDEQMIDKLERYLEVRDYVHWNLNVLELFRDFEKKMLTATTTEQMNEIWKDYIQTFE